MKISREVYQELKKYCLDVYPKQACGIIAFNGEFLCEHIPMKNAGAWPYGFQFDEVKQMKIMKDLAVKSLEIGIIYHVHITSKAYPTEKDVMRHYYNNILCGIVSLVDIFDFKIYKIIDKNITEQTLEIFN